MLIQKKGKTHLRRFFSTTFCLAFLISFGLLGVAVPAFAQQHTPVFRSHRVCSATIVNFAQCFAIQLDSTTNSANQEVTPNASAPGGLNPSDLQSAYNLPSSTAGSGQTVA